MYEIAINPQVYMCNLHGENTLLQYDQYHRDAVITPVYDNDMHAEFVDEHFPNVRYVIGIYCRYTSLLTESCTCGICHKLRASAGMNTITYFYDSDDMIDISLV